MTLGSAQLNGTTIAPTNAATAADPVEDGVTVITALDLLAHRWSRPVENEVVKWLESAEIEARILERIFGDAESGEQRLSLRVDDVPALLNEYERLFVGPGHVPCPPYESFWREDVPVDIRRSLMGPCSAELRTLYAALEIEVAPAMNEMADHIAVELEALAYALSFDETIPVARQIFFQHARQWLPRLCRAVINEAAHPFYRGLGGVTLDWLAYVQRYFETAREMQPETP